MTVGVVIILETIKGVVVSVAIDSTHSWTRRVAAVKIATVANTEEMERWMHMEKKRENRGGTKLLFNATHRSLNTFYKLQNFMFQIRFDRN